MTDQYTTISNPNTGEFRDRGSKFFGYAFPVFDNQDIHQRLEEVKKLHPKARHHCYAYRLGLDKNNFRANDAGEPSGTAGRPILGQIDSFEMTNLLIIVVRYFGGTKLGTSGLINAYKTTAKYTLETADPDHRTVEDIYEISFDYGLMNDVLTFVKKSGLEMVSKTFEVTPSIRIAIPQSLVDQIIKQLRKIGTSSQNFIQTR